MPSQRSVNEQIFDGNAFDAEVAASDTPFAVYRNALKHGKTELYEQFKQGQDIVELVHCNARLIDALLTRAWQTNFPDSAKDCALIAVGGYGRGELHPGSDVDLLLLFAEGQIEARREQIEAFLTMLWDIGMEVGQSVRTVQDCVKESGQDITVMTNLLESRLIIGSEALFDQMAEATSIKHIWPSDRFFEAKWKEQEQRHKKYDDAAYKLEPNIKESPGGLRDIQMIGWVTKRHFHTQDLHELVEHDFLLEEEYNTLLEGQRLLWRIRFALHCLTNRSEDRLLFDYQKPLAEMMGYQDEGHKLAVEQFMQQYYRAVMNTSRLNELLLQLFQEAILLKEAPEEPIPINRRFQSTRGFLEASYNTLFEHYPYALLEAFLLLQLHPELKGMRASTIRLIMSNAHLMDEDTRNDLRSRSIFIEILRQPQGITAQLRRMNRYGILAAYLPEFANIVGRMQYDLFHIYTVDEHILFVVRNLRRFTVPKYHDEFPLCSDIIQQIAKPELLYVAGLYHDIAKGRGGDHSELGEHDAIAFCDNHGLGRYDTRLVAWLVKNHLVMSMTAQRKDIRDPDVIDEFANLVGDKTHLDYLYLLTVADIRGTNPELWNSWKDSLLKELYYSTQKALRSSGNESASSSELITAKKQDVLDTETATKIGSDEIESLWESFPADYFIRYSTEEIVWHLNVIFSESQQRFPMVAVRIDPQKGTTAIFIFGPVHGHQFAVSAATLERLSLNIVDARIISTANNVTLDTYQVLEMDGRTVTDEQRLNDIRVSLVEALDSGARSPMTVNRRLPRRHKHFEIQTQIHFSLNAAKHCTVLEVLTQDSPGLLSRIGQAFMASNIILQTAKVATIGERIEDIFHITNDEDNPLTSSQQEQLEESLHHFIEQ